MSNWTKEADWISYTNAVGWVIFWKKDLQQILRAFYQLEGKVSTNDPGYLKTKEEIEVSRVGIEDALFKLKRSFKRLTENDKITWADKLPS